MAGFWEQLLDYFTRVDDILRKFNEDYVSGNARLINKLNELIGAVTGVEPEPEPEIPYRHTPFYVEDTITAGTDVVLLVKDDPEQGLGGVGKSGFIFNESGSSLYIEIDDGKGKSKKIRIDAGETLESEKADGIWFDKVTLSCTAGTVDYRALFSR